MTLGVAFIDCLNSREKASAFWLLVLVGFVLYKGPSSIGSSFIQLLRAAVAPKLALVFAASLAYCVLVVFVAAHLSVWHTDVLKETIYWFVGTGLIFVGTAIGSADAPNLMRRVARKTFRFAVLMEFFVGLYVLPIWVEMLVVPLALLFGMMQAYIATTPATSRATQSFVNGVIMVIGAGLLLWATFSIAHDFHSFLSRDSAERLWVGPGLSIALLPFLWALRRHSAWENEARARTLRS